METLSAKPHNGDYAGSMDITKEFPCNYNRISKDFNSLMYNDPKWSDTLQKFCVICCKSFNVCLTILWRYELKGERQKFQKKKKKCWEKIK